MSIDVSNLAATVVTSFLIPYAKLGFEELVEEMGNKLGEVSARKSVETFKKVWQRVKGVFKKEDKQVWAQFEKRPGAAKALVEEILKEKLEQDTELTWELSTLINQSITKDTSTGASISSAEIASILDLRGANFQNAQDVRLTGTSIEKE
jgi:hypothetical protein